VATQFHPEFKSRPTRPHPLFRGFVTAAAQRAHEQGVDRPSASVSVNAAANAASNGHAPAASEAASRQR
jgi:CTP synthase